jgi:hypothetical protein
VEVGPAVVSRLTFRKIQNNRNQLLRLKGCFI